MGNVITSIDELPEYPGYLWGYDLSLSGWGEFGFPETPDRLFGMDWDEYWGRGEWQNAHYGCNRLRQLCPVIYCLNEDTDEQLLRFNCNVCDVALQYDHRDGYRGQAAREPEGGWDAWAKRFEAENKSTYGHSIVYGFLAWSEVDRYAATGMHKTVAWLMKRGIPHITVRTPDSERWYKEPGLGWTFYDEDAQPFRYCHPQERPVKGDYAIVRRRRQGRQPCGERVELQTYTYRGRDRRYKVIPL